MNTIVAVFCITAIWDVVLRLLSTGRVSALGIETMEWVRVLKPYFEKHTVLAAALIAGFVGAVTYCALAHFGLSMARPMYSLFVIATVSGIAGRLMYFSGLFPHLVEHYYDKLSPSYSFAADAASGIIVAVTYAPIVELLRASS